jgi:hypothetical protein
MERYVDSKEAPSNRYFALDRTFTQGCVLKELFEVHMKSTNCILYVAKRTAVQLLGT